MINTDLKQINTDLLYGDLTYQIRGAIFAVYNELGHGHKENVYQKALLKELNEKGLSCTTEQNLKVKYKGENVGNYRPDIVVEGKIIKRLVWTNHPREVNQRKSARNQRESKTI